MGQTQQKKHLICITSRKFNKPNFKSISQKTAKTRHVFVKHRCPRRQQSQNMTKMSKSYILTTPHLQGRVMSVKCEEPIDEPTSLFTLSSSKL